MKKNKFKKITKLLNYFFRQVVNPVIDLWIFRNKDIESVFTTIYRTNRWGDLESVSGSGSTIRYTESIRKELPLIIDKYAINSILDAPCGDFNWMKNVLENTGVNYIGGDIAKPLIERNKLLYSNFGTFIHMDITKDDLPKVDLMIVRDCLFHLSEENVKLFLLNFVKSDIRYLLTTTHINHNDEFANSNIKNGDFRLLDLYSKPYSITTKVIYKFNDFIYPEPPREMILITRDMLNDSLMSSQ